MNFSPEALAQGLTYYVVLLFSLSFHESAHAWMASRLGDQTARDQGRVSLNPIVHMDPIGTVVMPLLQLVNLGIPLLAWAKPTPVVAAQFPPRHVPEGSRAGGGRGAGLELPARPGLHRAVLRGRANGGDAGGRGSPAANPFRGRNPERQPRGLQPRAPAAARRVLGGLLRPAPRRWAEVYDRVIAPLRLLDPAPPGIHGCPRKAILPVIDYIQRLLFTLARP